MSLLATLTVAKAIRIILFGIGAWLSATKIESIWGRVFGLGYLGASGFGMVIVGFGNIWMLLFGLAYIGAAIHAWSFTRM